MKETLIESMKGLIPNLIVINLKDYKKGATKSFLEMYYQLCDTVTKKTYNDILAKLVLDSQTKQLATDAQVKYEVTALICQRIVIQ